MMKILRSAAQYLFIFLLWVTIWQLCALKIGEELLLPAPLTVVRRLGEMMLTSDFYKTVWRSLLRILLGMSVGILIGALGGILTAFLSAAKAFFAPILAIVKSTPVASFIILLVLWVDRDRTAIVIAAMMVIPVVWSNVEEGITSTDLSLLEMGKAYKMSLPQRIFKIYLPCVIPYFCASLRSSLGLAWKAGIAAEVLLQPTVAIGKMIFGAKLMLETVDLFAWTAVVIILSVIIEKSALALLRLILKKYSLNMGGGGNLG